METDVTNLFYTTLQQYPQQEYSCETIDVNSMKVFRDLSPLMDDSFYVIDIRHASLFI